MRFFYKKQIFGILLVMAVSLAGCRPSPKTSVVVSKNDGAFDISKAISAEEHNEPDATESLQYEDVFFSTDGSVKFEFDIKNDVTAADMPVVEVIPHFISSDEANHIAQILFGDVDFYEAEALRSENYSKEEVLEKIERWTQYTSEEKIREIYGMDQQTDVTLIVSKVKSYIKKYTELYETAPDANPHILSSWQFKKASEFLIPEDDLLGMDTSNDNDEISVQTNVNGIPYLFTVSNRDRQDFKVNLISAYISPGMSPMNIDQDIFRALLCRTEEPTAEQIALIQSKVIYMLEEMNLGEWKIDSIKIEKTFYGDIPEYVVSITAVPILEGRSAIRQPQLTTLRKSDQYASNYFLTDVAFKYSAEGHLVSFEMYSPLDIKNVFNSNVQVLSMDALVSRAKEILTHSDYYEYGYGLYIPYIKDELTCNVHVDRIEYNLIRVKVPNSDDSYYYVPGIAFYGKASYVGKKNGNLYYESEASTNLLVLNAVDGTVISIGKD